MLIDSHCHLAAFAKRGDLDDVLNEASSKGVSRMITVGTSIDDWDLYHDLSVKYPGIIYHSVGLHPCDVDADWEYQINKLTERLEYGNSCAPVALGEIGLDYFHLPKEEDQREELIAYQKQAFLAQLEIAKSSKLPVIIHSRNAFDDCVKIIDSSRAVWDRIVFHCFSEGKDEMDRINLRGGRGSFTGIITYQNKSTQRVKEALVEQGEERLMIETDCPYLTPVPHRGKENRPAFVRHTFQQSAALLEAPVVELEEVITQNTIDFFQLD